MANILFLAHRIPYPPNKGDKIRSWNFLERMAHNHTVHAGFFVDRKEDIQHVPFLEGKLASVCWDYISPTTQKLLGLRALLTNTSLTENAYSFSRLRKYCNKLILNENIDLIYLYSAVTGRLVPASWAAPLVVDFVDADSAKWAAYAESAMWPMSWLFHREERTLRRYEAQLAKRATANIFVSDDEAAYFKAQNPEVAEKTLGITNGVNVRFFDPGRFSHAANPQKVLFTGAMDYEPNIEAVEWFVEHVWPHIHNAHQNARFEVAGGPLTARTRKLATKSGVSVLGYVDDMAEIISSAGLVVAPLRTARGIQNKILEALAMEKAVVTTTLGNEGINAKNGEHLLIADSGEEFIAAMEILFLKPEEGGKLGRNARQFVQQAFSWDEAYNQLEKVMFPS